MKKPPEERGISGGEATPVVRSRYASVAIALHWLIAVAILTNLWLGWCMGHAEGMDQFRLFQLHKSVGITVLLLAIVRIAWRLSHRPPPYPAGMTPFERRAAGGLHALFYLLMLALPLSGWVIVSASAYNLPTLLFGAVPWPHIAPVHDLPAASRQLVEDRTRTAHMWLAWLFLALIALHVAAALKHHFHDRDDVLARMLPRLRRRARNQG